MKLIRKDKATDAATPIKGRLIAVLEYMNMPNVIQDPISAKLKSAIKASLNLESDLVVISEIVTMMKQINPKIAKGKNQLTISTHLLFPVSL